MLHALVARYGNIVWRMETRFMSNLFGRAVSFTGKSILPESSSAIELKEIAAIDQVPTDILMEE